MIDPLQWKWWVMSFYLEIQASLFFLFPAVFKPAVYGYQNSDECFFLAVVSVSGYFHFFLPAMFCAKTVTAGFPLDNNKNNQSYTVLYTKTSV